MKASNIKLSNYFNGRIFNIPIYQRKLTWDNDKFDEFYDELNSGYKTKYSNNIFMGSIFLVSDSDSSQWDICDGQQRTTFFIFMFKAFEKVLTEKMDQIRDENLTKIRRENKKNFFDEYLDSISKMTIYREKAPIIFDDLKNKEKKRYMQLIDKFRIDMVDVDDIFDKFDFIIYCLENINLTLNIIESSDDFNDVFHSLNSKNVPLSDWDILRNFVYKSNEILDENFLKKIDSYVNRNKDDKNKNKIDFKDTDKVLSAFYMFRKREVIKNEKEKLQKIEALIKVNFELELNYLLNSFKAIIEFKNNETKDELKELIVIFKLIKKLNLKQIEKIFLWTVIEHNGFMETDILQLRKILSFYSKLIINFVYFVTINNQRANFFEKFIKRSIFLKDVFDKKYDYDLIFKDFEEFNFVLSETSIENAKSNDSIIKRLNENYKMVYLLLLISATDSVDFIILDKMITFKKVMLIDRKIMSNYYFYGGPNSPSILDLEHQNQTLINDLQKKDYSINNFIKDWLLNIVDDEEDLTNKNTQMIDSFFEKIKSLNN